LARNDAGKEVIPSAKRLINSLRSLGYEFPTAIAELVDNSIEAEATEVFIKVEFDGENSWVMIADNGNGMSAEKLKESMRFGSASIYNDRSLGKFGLGLKTASFSQCKQWLVATRSESSDNEIVSFKWDLDHVNETDRWEILPIKKRGLDPVINDYLRNKTGTVVFWQGLDRVLDYDNPNTERARKKMINLCRELEMHLAMVFHRFLMGEVPEKKLKKIFLNDNEIRPWDPFARDEKATKELDVIRIPIENDGTHGELVIEPYILPPIKAFSTPQAHSKAGGPKKWNQQQGFYVYRNDRMIQSGGWCRIRTYDEHTKLARFAINFSSKLDGAFKIDVSKMYVSLPPQIRTQVSELTSPLVYRAREIYDNSEKPPAVTPSLNSFTAYEKPSQNPDRLGIPKQNQKPEENLFSSYFPGQITAVNSIHEKTVRPVIIEEDTQPDTEKMWTLEEIFRELKKSAKFSEIPVIERVFERFREQIQKNGK